MSKRNPKDKSTYTFARLGLGKLGHGKITFDCNSMTTCPNCKEEYNFGKGKVIGLAPRYPNNYVDKVTGVKQPDYFWMEWELNTPSVDENGKGDHLPRVSFVIKACKMTIEDKIWDSNKVTDTMTLRTNKDRSLQLSILEMNEGEHNER